MLFLCTGNSARSQMAEGLLRHYSADEFEVVSAGTHPGVVNPLAIQAMREIGIDISGHSSKPVSLFEGIPVQYVVTVCDRAKQSCPIFPGTLKSLNWSFEDPAEATGSAEEKLAVFRRVRDEIGERIQEQFVKVPSRSKGR